MEIFKLEPYKSVGPICFTDTVDDIIKKLGEPKEISRTGEFLIYENFLIEISLINQNVYSVSLCNYDQCKICYEGINLNVLDYKKVVKELFHKNHTIYGNFSSFPEYVDKNAGVIFVTHETDIDNTLELECLGIWSLEAMPDFNDKNLCQDDVLITSEDQII